MSIAGPIIQGIQKETLLIFYFSIYYRPLRLLDSMLADIVNDTGEAVILYGPEGRCIWTNEPAKELTGIKYDNPENVAVAFTDLFGLSKDLAIVSLAEGVETIEHFDKLNEMGCNLFQGYYFSKPVPLSDFEAMLEQE